MSTLIVSLLNCFIVKLLGSLDVLLGFFHQWNNRAMKQFLVMFLVFQFLTIPLYPVLQVSEVYAQPVRDQWYKDEPEPGPVYQAPNVEENVLPEPRPVYEAPAPRYNPPRYVAPPVYYQAPNVEENELPEAEPEWVPEEEVSPIAETEQPAEQEAAAPAGKTAYEVCMEENPGSGYCDAIFYGIGQPVNEPEAANEEGLVEETLQGGSRNWWETVTDWPAEAWGWVKDKAEETGESIQKVVEDSGDAIASLFGGEEDQSGSGDLTSAPEVRGPQPQDPEWAGKIAQSQADWEAYQAQALAEDPQAASMTKSRMVASLGLDSAASDEQILQALNSSSGAVFSGSGNDLAVQIETDTECEVEGGCIAHQKGETEAPQFDLFYSLTHIPGPVEIGIRLLDGFITNGAGGIGLDYSAKVLSENEVDNIAKTSGILEALEGAGETGFRNEDGSVNHQVALQTYLKLNPDQTDKAEAYRKALSEAQEKQKALTESALSFATGGGSDSVISAIDAGEGWKNTAERLEELVFNKPEVWAVLREDPSIYMPGDPDGNIDMAALARATRRYYESEGNQKNFALANQTVESAEKADKDYTAGVAQGGALAITLLMGGAAAGVPGALANVYLPLGLDDAVTGAVNARAASKLADTANGVVPRAPGTEVDVEVPIVPAAPVNPPAAPVRTIADAAEPEQNYAWYDPRRWVGMKPQDEAQVPEVTVPEELALKGRVPTDETPAVPVIGRTIDPNPEAEAPRIEGPAPRDETPGEAAAPEPVRNEPQVETPTQIADGPKGRNPEEPTPIRPQEEIPCAASLPAGFQLIKEVYAQEGGKSPCRAWYDPRGWVENWFGDKQPDSPNVGNITDEADLADIEKQYLDALRKEQEALRAFQNDHHSRSGRTPELTVEEHVARIDQAEKDREALAQGLSSEQIERVREIARSDSPPVSNPIAENPVVEAIAEAVSSTKSKLERLREQLGPETEVRTTIYTGTKSHFDEFGQVTENIPGVFDPIKPSQINAQRTKVTDRVGPEVSDYPVVATRPGDDIFDIDEIAYKISSRQQNQGPEFSVLGNLINQYRENPSEALAQAIRREAHNRGIVLEGKMPGFAGVVEGVSIKFYAVKDENVIEMANIYAVKEEINRVFT